MKLQVKTAPEQLAATAQLKEEAESFLAWASALHAQVEFNVSENGEGTHLVTDSDEAIGTRRSFQNLKSRFELAIQSKRERRKTTAKKTAKKAATKKR